MLSTALAFSVRVRDDLRDIALVVGAIIGMAAVLKLAWHPRSWFRRAPSYIVAKVIVEPAAMKLTSFLERFIDRVLTPKIDAVLKQVAALSDRNDAQHASNVESINALSVRVDATNEGLLHNNGKLADLSTDLARHIPTSVVPVTVPGETP